MVDHNANIPEKMIRFYQAVESLMFSCTIDAKEKQDVSTADIPGEFMQADMAGNVNVQLERNSVELLANFDPNEYDNLMNMYKGKIVCEGVQELFWNPPDTTASLATTHRKNCQTVVSKLTLMTGVLLTRWSKTTNE